ncbi:MAG: hypothetical protein WAK75_01105 [Methanoregula sp.]|uniref:hypothetical protein n=1 Tax=Methanoregula sp. TaxID=2052170 RepID=UPI003BAF30BE
MDEISKNVRIDQVDKTAKKFSLNDGFMEFRDENFLLWDAGLILTCASSANTCAPARPHGSVKKAAEISPWLFVTQRKE